MTNSSDLSTWYIEWTPPKGLRLYFTPSTLMLSQLKPDAEARPESKAELVRSEKRLDCIRMVGVCLSGFRWCNGGEVERRSSTSELCDGDEQAEGNISLRRTKSDKISSTRSQVWIGVRNVQENVLERMMAGVVDRRCLFFPRR